MTRGVIDLGREREFRQVKASLQALLSTYDGQQYSDTLSSELEQEVRTYLFGRGGIPVPWRVVGWADPEAGVIRMNVVWPTEVKLELELSVSGVR